MSNKGKTGWIQNLNKTEITAELKKRSAEFDETDTYDNLRKLLRSIIKSEKQAGDSKAGTSEKSEPETEHSDSETVPSEEDELDNINMMSDIKFEFRLDDDWELFEEKLTCYMLTRNVTDEKIKVATLVTKLSTDAHALLKQLTAPAKITDKKYDDLTDLMTKQLKPKPSEAMERCTFHMAKQNPNEKIADYVARLKKLALHCNFDKLDDSLRDQLVCGLSDTDTKIKLFEEKDLTLAKALEVSIARESAVKNATSTSNALDSKVSKSNMYYTQSNPQQGSQGHATKNGAAHSKRQQQQQRPRQQQQKQKQRGSDSKSAPSKTPLTTWPYPNKVWGRIHCDFAKFDGDMYLIVIDAHSKWPEIINCKNNTDAKRVIQEFKKLIVRFGLPLHCVTDGGPQFRSTDFMNFLKVNCIKHSFSPPYFPATNGAAENFIQTFKDKVSKIMKRGEKAEAAINRFLFDYRKISAHDYWQNTSQHDRQQRSEPSSRPWAAAAIISRPIHKARDSSGGGGVGSCLGVDRSGIGIAMRSESTSSLRHNRKEAGCLPSIARRGQAAYSSRDSSIYRFSGFVARLCICSSSISSPSIIAYIQWRKKKLKRRVRDLRAAHKTVAAYLSIRYVRSAALR
ncbi:unnamed protein product [Trichogramma brassicae]|uniref:Integrase catalytic domain-containing protein n=1 Tax=Trichogramma brassicae TaxID=86971 RepID=A0A6H5J6M7_9HYME|nr:unnamed protein product [Trichogramma brassicae]